MRVLLVLKNGESKRIAAVIGLSVLAAALITILFGFLIQPKPLSGDAKLSAQIEYSVDNGGSNREPEDSIGNERRDHDRETGVVQHPVKPTNTNTGKSQTPSHTDRDEQRKEADLLAQRDMATYARRMNLATWIAALAAACAFLALLVQLWDTHKMGKRQTRAYVLHGTAFLDCENGTMTAEVGVKNFGQSPALEFQAWVHYWVAPFPLDQELPPPPDDFLMGKGVIGPGTSYRCRTAREKNSFPHRGLTEKIESGEMAVYVYGHISYRDIFGDSQETNYVLFTKGVPLKGEVGLMPYTHGNTAT